MFLMPSRYEPCGLNQIYSLRYGTVPVVRATGGLDDTIEPFDRATGRGTGFKFEEYTGAALLAALREALAVYADKAAWRRVQTNGMAKDFSWNASAAGVWHGCTMWRERHESELQRYHLNRQLMEPCPR